MMCIKHVLVYFLLLPVPAASPLFLALFAIAAFVAIKPCGYCLSLLAILFLSTSPHSPFLSNSTPPLSFPALEVNTTLSELPLDALIPNRSWFNLNGWRVTQPSLVGYEEMDRAVAASLPASEKGFKGVTRRFFSFEMIQPTVGPNSPASRANSEIKGSVLDQIIAPYLPSSSSPSSSSAINAPGSSPTEKKERERTLPRNHLDLSWKGVGLIVDFGWKRSEEGIKFEIEEALGREWARPLPPTETGTEKLDESTSGETATSAIQGQDAGRARDAEGRAKKGFWDRVPLVGGSW